MSASRVGLVAEWLRSGLQIRAPRFDSGRGLQPHFPGGAAIGVPMDKDEQTATAPLHGGDLTFARQLYGEPAGGWLDLSTGINPRPYPLPPFDPALLSRLPDRTALADLVATARRLYGAPDNVAMTAVPGTEVALRLLPSALPQGAVAIVSPTYPSHADAWRRGSHMVVEVADADAIPADARFVVVTNPNNPDGRTHEPDQLAGLARQLAERGGVLVVDEAFGDVEPRASLMPFLDRAPAVVLRSFGKFFGLPGLRLGFFAGPPPIVDRITQLFGDWPVSSHAIAAARIALADIPWRDQTRERLQQDTKALRALLARHSLRIVGGTNLFTLVGHTDAGLIHQALARHGIWTRVFPYRRDWLRVGLPAIDRRLC